MKRFENWPRLLADVLAEKAASEFIWGKNDCCLFIADCVLAITGFDYADEWRGLYQSKEGAEAFVANYGDINGLLDYAIGAENRILPTFAGRGDVVTVNGAAGIVDDTGRRVALYVDGAGLARVSVNKITAAWRIG